MDTHEPLERLLDTLLTLKVTLRDTASASVNHQLDEAIAELRQIIENGEASEITHSRALAVVGKVIRILPSIAKIIELFSG